MVDPASAYHQLTAFPHIGLNLIHADNNVETGILTVFERLATGQLRTFRTCQNWFREFRQYHRDAKGSGKIVKLNDHLMDATRYLCVSGIAVMRVRPAPGAPAYESSPPDGMDCRLMCNGRRTPMASSRYRGTKLLHALAGLPPLAAGRVSHQTGTETFIPR